MPLKNYGVLKGRAIDRRLGFGASPHYEIHIIDDDFDYRIAINVKSKQHPSELLYIIDDSFSHPITDYLPDLSMGFTDIQSNPDGIALDYIRGNLFDPKQMLPLPHDLPGPDNDLNEKIDYYILRAINDGEAILYSFGEKWGPEENKKDKYFGFKPGYGIHDIHMNQGSCGRFKDYNHVRQDGALLMHFPSNNQWVAVFLAFQSQCRHTDDVTGHCINGSDTDQIHPEGRVMILAALVNPLGHDPGMETVTLLNTMPDTIKLDGWHLSDKNKRKYSIGNKTLDPGEVITVTLPVDSIQLGNKGGIITLLDEGGLKVHGVSYTKNDAGRRGWTIVF